MEQIDEGSNGRIYAHPTRGIVKVVKRGICGLDFSSQMRIHRLCHQILTEAGGRFFVPALLPNDTFDIMCTEYRMERIDTSRPVTLAHDYSLLPEFIALWKKMWYHGFALYDFELYQQPDGRIALIDFDKTCFRQTNPLMALFKYPFQVFEGENLNHFYFKHPCFPYVFLEELVGSEGGIEAQLKRLAALPYHG